jgi:uncharacterized protein (TIGR02145 family)
LQSDYAQNTVSADLAGMVETVDCQVSLTGDTLFTGDSSYITLPGISMANAHLHGQSGNILLPGNSICNEEFIATEGCHGQTELTYQEVDYPVVEINGQCWMAANLRSAYFRNGESIPEFQNDNDWSVANGSASAIYNHDENNLNTYGRLYNGFAVMDQRELCPSGWHVPSDCEWMYLEQSLGMPVDMQMLGNQSGRGTIEGGKLKALEGWNDPNMGATDSLQFKLLPGGFRDGGGYFNGLGVACYLWTRSSFQNQLIWNREFNTYDAYMNRNWHWKNMAYSVRCVKGITQAVITGCTEPNACNYLPSANVDDGSCKVAGTACDDRFTDTDNDAIDANCQCTGTLVSNGLYSPGDGVVDVDGNFYPTLIINNQEWMRVNLQTTHYRNGDSIAWKPNSSDWRAAEQGAYCYYLNDIYFREMYGNLYNFYAVADLRGLCPVGWHVPSDDEWNGLVSIMHPYNSSVVVGIESSFVGGKLKATEGWSMPNVGANDEVKLAFLPGGYRDWAGGFLREFKEGGWWSSGNAYNASYNPDRVIFHDSTALYKTSSPRSKGRSVRCLRD